MYVVFVVISEYVGFSSEEMSEEIATLVVVWAVSIPWVFIPNTSLKFQISN